MLSSRGVGFVQGGCGLVREVPDCVGSDCFSALPDAAHFVNTRIGCFSREESLVLRRAPDVAIITAHIVSLNGIHVPHRLTVDSEAQ